MKDGEGYTCACKAGYTMSRDRLWCVKTGVNLPKIKIMEEGFTNTKIMLNFLSPMVRIDFYMNFYITVRFHSNA